jgi:hypothetical protein
MEVRPYGRKRGALRISTGNRHTGVATDGDTARWERTPQEPAPPEHAVIGIAMLRIALPGPTTWVPAVVLSTVVGFVLGYLSPGPLDQHAKDSADEEVIDLVAAEAVARASGAHERRTTGGSVAPNESGAHDPAHESGSHAPAHESGEFKAHQSGQFTPHESGPIDPLQ